MKADHCEADHCQADRHTADRRTADPRGVLTGTHFIDGDHACCEGALAAGAPTTSIDTVEAELVAVPLAVVNAKLSSPKYPASGV